MGDSMWAHTKRLEERLRDLSDQYNKSTSDSSKGFWNWEWGTEKIWYSPECWILLGFNPSGPFPENRLSSFIDRLHPDDVERWQEELRQHVEFGKPYNINFRLWCVTGEYRWFRVQGYLQRNCQGHGIAMLGTVRDISQQLYIELVLSETQLCVQDSFREITALRSALDQHSLLSVADRSGKIIDVNTAFCEISGYKKEDLLGQDHRILNSGFHPKSFWKEMWRRIAAGEAWQGEVCNRRKDGSLYWVNSTIVPYLGAEGKIEKYVSIRFDITAQKAAERALLAAQAGAEAANAAKSEFIANMSHEIRTPMTAILGFTELIAAESIDCPGAQGRLNEYVATIRRNGEHLLQIINDILDISKIEAGKLFVERIETNPLQLIHEVVNLMDIRARSKGISLTMEVLSPIPKLVDSDPLRVRQILVNLIGNSIKFTDKGSVSIRCSFDAIANQLIFAVVDSGIGISDEQKENLFEAFVQADTSTSRRFGGTGLGLRISKRLAQLLGGDIDCESTLGHGSTFTVSIDAGKNRVHEFITLNQYQESQPPLTIQSSSPIEVKESSTKYRLERMRILLAEDGPDNQRLISHILKKAGADVVVVENGLEAARRLNALDDALFNPCPFDLVLTDMQMPILDGYELVKMLREKGASVPIIALTAHAMTSDEEKCLLTGCDGYASKPIDKNHLIELCHEWGRKDPATLRPPRTDLWGVSMPLEKERTPLTSMLAKDPEMIELVRSFIDTLPQKIGIIRRSFSEKDYECLFVLAHQLKGSGGGYGFPEISDAAAELESRISSLGQVEHIKEAVQELVQLCERAQLEPIGDLSPSNR